MNPARVPRTELTRLGEASVIYTFVRMYIAPLGGGASADRVLPGVPAKFLGTQPPDSCARTQTRPKIRTKRLSEPDGPLKAENDAPGETVASVIDDDIATGSSERRTPGGPRGGG